MALKKLEWWDRYKVADDSTDIRGWKLLDRDGHGVGAIIDLMFDDDSCQVLYAVTEVTGRRVLVPVGMLALDEEKRQAVATQLTGADIDRLTGYAGESALDAESERRFYRDYQADWEGQMAGTRLNYAGNPYIHNSSRLERIEERLRRHGDVHTRETTFAGTEPTAEDDRDRGGMWT